MDDDLRRALVEELERFAPIPRPPQPGDLTVEAVQQMLGCTRNVALTWLDRHVEAGRLVKLAGLSPVTNKPCNLYRKVE